MDVALVLALWLHTVGLVIAVGYYLVLGRVIVPNLARSLHGADLAEMLGFIERRAVPLLVLAIVLFVLTGTYLLVINPNYQGLGHFFDTTWATLMLVKHVVVIAVVALGVLVDWLARDLVYAADEAELQAKVRRLRLSADAAAMVAVLAILLSAAAQASA